MHLSKSPPYLAFFLCSVSLLIVIGLLFIYSASSVFALEKIGYAHFFVKKQLFGVALGIILLIFTSLVPLWLIKKCAGLIFTSTALLTACTLIPRFTTTINGSTRWLNIGPLMFQPSELLKLATILYVARIIADHENTLQKNRSAYIPVGIVILIDLFLSLRQPDFGMACTLATTCCMLLFTIRFKLKEIICISCCAGLAAIILIAYYPYRLRRFLIFLNPWNDPQGAGFQIIQSLIAIGSGGWWGVGISHSKQKFFYLPMQHTDFIFSIIAEEVGFMGCSFLISIFIGCMYWGFKIAASYKDLWMMLYTQGFIIIISLQAIINLAVALGLVPTKGIGLPFVSYGNSALIAYLGFIGLIINAWRISHTYRTSS